MTGATTSPRPVGLTADVILKSIPVVIMIFTFGVAWNNLSSRMDRLNDYLINTDRRVSALDDQFRVRGEAVNAMVAKSEVMTERLNQLGNRTDEFMQSVSRSLEQHRGAQMQEHRDILNALDKSFPGSLHPRDR